ncbi:MAG TPA: T9SS type A sorting domain-containing protein, partial [Catalimonadaceae bacterium]|nr:T9SS type A sorting domain-containing protein [Catalimonadaceae bacterium]
SDALSGSTRVTVTDQLGRDIQTVLTVLNDQTLNLELPGAATGSYICKVQKGDKVLVSKLSVQ